MGTSGNCANCSDHQQRLLQFALSQAQKENTMSDPTQYAEQPGEIHPLGHVHGSNCPYAPAHRDGGRQAFPNGQIVCAQCGYELRSVGDFRPLQDEIPPPVSEPIPVLTPEQFLQAPRETQQYELYRLMYIVNGHVDEIGHMVDWLVQNTSSLFSIAEQIKSQGITPQTMFKMMLGR